MVIAQFSIKFLIDDPPDQDESVRMVIGWVFISCCIGILVVQLIFVFANLIVDTYRELIKLIKKCKNTSKKETIQAEPADNVNIEDID